MDTKSQQAGADVTALLRARNSLLWVITREEVRVERAIVESAAAADYETLYWDCATGLSKADGTDVDRNGDPSAVLARIRDNRQRAVYVLRDLHRWLNDPIVLRSVRSLARTLQAAPRNEARAIVVLTPSSDVPPELSGHASVIDWPLPERREIASILDDVVSALPADVAKDAAPNGTRDAAIDAAVGLTAEEAASCYARSLVTTRKIATSETSLSIMWFSTAAVTLAGLTTAPLGWAPLTARDVGLFALSGMLVGGAHYLLIERFRWAEAALVAPFKYTNLIWAVVIGFIVWGDLPDSWTFAGAAVVVSSGLYIVRREARRPRKTAPVAAK